MDGGRGEPISFLSVEVPVMWCGAGREAVNAEFGAAEPAARLLGGHDGDMLSSAAAAIGSKVDLMRGGKFTLSETFDTFRHFSTLVDTCRKCRTTIFDSSTLFDTCRHCRLKNIFITEAYSNIFIAKQFDLCVAVAVKSSR